MLWAEDAAQSVKCLPDMPGALGCIPSINNLAWRHIPVTPALRRWKQELKVPLPQRD